MTITDNCGIRGEKYLLIGLKEKIYKKTVVGKIFAVIKYIQYV